MSCILGEANWAIKLYQETERACQHAVNILQERFGRPFQILKSCIDGEVEWPRLSRESEALPLSHCALPKHTVVEGERDLKEALPQWNQDQVKRGLLQMGIRWHFQLPGASHMLGVWERLVRSMKLALKAIFEGCIESLVTSLVEGEEVHNRCPLCKSSHDPSDDEVLTSNHFLLQRGAVSLPPGVFVETDQYHRKR